MNYKEAFNDSYSRCRSDSDDLFYERFYQIFISKSSAVREKFKDVNIKNQIKMLRSSMLFMMSFTATYESTSSLKRLAAYHHELSIESELFDIWIDSLIKVIEEFDDQYNPETEMAWRVMLSPGLTYMKCISKKGPSVE